MRSICLALAVLALVHTEASAAGFGRRGPDRAPLWINIEAQSAAQDRADTATSSKYPMTYTEGLASRFGVGTGHADLFSSKLMDHGPSLAATVDTDGPKLLLRWRTDE